jgi:hypothetical protein
VLIGGGFQRAAFEAIGGVYPTESRAISVRSGRRAAPPSGRFDRHGLDRLRLASPKRRPLLTRSRPDRIPRARRCHHPALLAHRRLVDRLTPTRSSRCSSPTAPSIREKFTASAYNKSNDEATLTAYGYCLGEGCRRRPEVLEEGRQADKNTKTNVDQTVTRTAEPAFSRDRGRPESDVQVIVVVTRRCRWRPA